jgi:DGQHR domain-containing protein
MNNGKPQSHTFFSVRVIQRDFTLYLSSLKASDLHRLCEGLRPPESRELPLGNDVGQVTKDAAEFVAAVSASHFAAEVSEIEADPYGEDNPYQRLIDEARVRSIAAYLREEFALMPNGVVLAVSEKTTCTIREKKRFAALRLEWDEGLPTNIIDGQHRVEGLKLLLKDGFPDFDDFELPVCILVDLPLDDPIKLSFKKGLLGIRLAPCTS